ncbi:MAG: hypothetical protein K8F52_04185 [Candidatus Scalindua rubra]|nr:hypothetical protein [Candidatus Scalindua rubra]TWU29189.1 hypothetical protein S225a_25660 [Candidatus Brocadiaceae bacterium S225]
MSKCYSIDYDIRKTIEDFIKSADDREINVRLKQPLAKTIGKEEDVSRFYKK